jgi:glycosyltransferase involved in cell wall biosynthesis
MKICFITENLSIVGGVQRVLSVVANSLIDNHSVSVLMTSPKRISAKLVFSLNENIDVIREEQLSGGRAKYLFPYKVIRYMNKNLFEIKNVGIKKWAYFPQKEIDRFNDYFIRNHFDVLIGVQPRAAALVSALSGSFKKVGWMHSPYDAYFKNPMMWQYRQENMYKEMLPRLDKLVVLTEHDRIQFDKEFSNQGGLTERIYNPLSFTSKEKVSLIHKSDATKLLFVGRLIWSTKGLGLLLEILSYLKRMELQFTLDVVGDGPDHERFIMEATRMGVNDNIKMHGFQSDVKLYYLKSDILLLPSRWEGFGLVVTEAMECGLPVVSFRTEGPEEIMSDGLAECLINKYDTKAFAEKVFSLARDRNHLQELGKFAEKRAKDFSLETIISQWNKLLYG